MPCDEAVKRGEEGEAEYKEEESEEEGEQQKAKNLEIYI